MSKFQKISHLFFVLFCFFVLSCNTCNLLSLLIRWMGSETSLLSNFCQNHFHNLYSNNWNCNQLYFCNNCIWLLLTDLHSLYKQHSGHIFLLTHTYSLLIYQNGHLCPGLNNSYIYRRVHTIGLSIYKQNVICIQASLNSSDLTQQGLMWH